MKLNDQPWGILIRHEHRRKQIHVLLTRKMIKKIHNYRPVSLCRKYLRHLSLKKKLTWALPVVWDINVFFDETYHEKGVYILFA